MLKAAILTIISYFVLSFSKTNVWQPGILRNGIWTKGNWKGVQQGEESDANRIQGGSRVTDREEFPWFAFLSTAFPDLTWKIWDPVTNTTRYEVVKLPWSSCGGVWITSHLVITNNHCVYLSKPKYHVLIDSGDNPRTSVQEDPLYRNVITDPVHGSLLNVAIRLYGLSNSNSHPFASNPYSHDVAGTLHPWWEGGLPKDRAFRIVDYRTMPTTDPPMDLAILAMNKVYIENYFRRSSIDINEIFGRLEWADTNEAKLQVGQNIIQVGTGQVSDAEQNHLKMLYITKDFARVSDSVCKQYSRYYTPAWEICLKTRSNARIRPGDSGSPGFTLLHIDKDKKTTYRLHSILSGWMTADPSVIFHIFVGDLRDEILNRMN